MVSLGATTNSPISICNWVGYQCKLQSMFAVTFVVYQKSTQGKVMTQSL
jgi:hypothetical protein